MPTDTLREMEEFRDFLNNLIESGDVDASIEDCLEQWRKLRRPADESIAAIRAGLQEAKAGLGQPYREFLDVLRANPQDMDHKVDDEAPLDWDFCIAAPPERRTGHSSMRIGHQRSDTGH